ncbi:MAG: hypothetical protein LUH22_04000 [Bacteroides sp.]|nr:hypothetical protein [Bacteroides sp.]
MKNHFSTLTALLLAIAVTSSCDDNNDIVPAPEYGWGVAMAGNDPNERTWPDLSENYWEYTFNLSKHAEGSVGLRFTGQFPNVDTRFFNITLYSDRTTERFGSMEDFNIIPESGSQNPFLNDGVTGSNYFAVNAIPSTADASKYKNAIVFPANTERITMLLRIYFNSIEHGSDFGGVDLPKITYFDVNTGEDIGEAPRGKSLYYTRFLGIMSRVPLIKSQPKLYFTLAPNVLYQNGPTGYVTTANRMHKDSTLMFRFIPPVHPNSVAENATADVRYWSICIGDTTTYTLTTLVDRTVLKDEKGYVNVMIADPQNTHFSIIKNKAAEMKINLVEWNVEKHGEPMMAFYRQMYIRKDFEYSVQKIATFPRLDDLGHPDPTDTTPGPEQLANIVLGEHGPFGYKKHISFFLNDNFKLEDIRPKD